jgi:hypothetical protein
MRKVYSLRPFPSLSSGQPLQQLSVDNDLCDQVAELRIELTNAIGALEDTMRQTEQILIRVPLLMRSHD